METTVSNFLYAIYYSHLYAFCCMVVIAYQDIGGGRMCVPAMDCFSGCAIGVLAVSSPKGNSCMPVAAATYLHHADIASTATTDATFLGDTTCRQENYW